MPNGLTQKWSVYSGSRTVMWPATPSPNPSRPKIRSAPASLLAPVVALLFDSCELRRERHDDLLRRELDATDGGRVRRYAVGVLGGVVVSVMAMSFTLLPVRARA